VIVAAVVVAVVVVVKVEVKGKKQEGQLSAMMM